MVASTTAARKTIPITPENKCSFCKGSTCCTYITQEIPTPRTIEDFDAHLWQLSHYNVCIYKEHRGGWYLLINNTCRNLGADGRCAIYDTRPDVCRNHSNDGCEFDGPVGKEDFDLYFDSYGSLLKYCKKRFKSMRNRA